jgi:hypothetical protein
MAVDMIKPGDIPDDPLTSYAFQEAVYMQLVMSGALDSYEMIHCLAPIVTPLYVLAAKGMPVIQTVTTAASHPAASLLPCFLGKKMRQVLIGSYKFSSAVKSSVVSSIPPCINLQEWVPAAGVFPQDHQDYLYWPGRKGDEGEEEARLVAAATKLPLFCATDGHPAQLMRNARLIIDLSVPDTACGYTWLIRALACGLPVAAWDSKATQELFQRPELGVFAPEGDWRSLADRIPGALANGRSDVAGIKSDVAGIRREYAMGHFGQRALAARYREVYKSLLV